MRIPISIFLGLMLFASVFAQDLVINRLYRYRGAERRLSLLLRGMGVNCNCVDIYKPRII